MSPTSVIWPSNCFRGCLPLSIGRAFTKKDVTVSDHCENGESIQGNLLLHLYDNVRHVKDLIGSHHFKEDDKKGVDVPFFSFESIQTATNNFSDANNIGQGAFGPVYKGKFAGGQEIVVKRLPRYSIQGLREYTNEVLLITKLQHWNLVRLLGYCVKGDEKILLYEYMPNGSLDHCMFHRKLHMVLDWKLRFNIILGIARGLLYLHQEFMVKIIHRDLKLSNILLDEEWNPKITDFGLAWIFRSKQTEENADAIVGTRGYMPPEYTMHGVVSVKTDVFSFGVVLLEIISGKRYSHLLEQDLYLLDYAWRLWNEGKALDLMDETLRETCDTNEFVRCLHVGLLCVQEDPSDRPTMSKVVFVLGNETVTLPSPKQPAFTDKGTYEGVPFSTTTSSNKLETSSNNELSILSSFTML